MSTLPTSPCPGQGSLGLDVAGAGGAEAIEASAAVGREYHPELSTPALIAEVRQLLNAERRAGRLVCRYLADLADRIGGRGDGELTADVDEFQALACFFDLGAREARERVRVGRALRILPLIEAEFVAGRLSYSRVREVTRVARPETESAWLELGRSLDMRALERRVASAADGAAVEPKGAEPKAAEPSQDDDAALSSPALDMISVLHPLSPAGDCTSMNDCMTANDRGMTDPSRGAARAHTEWLARDAVRVTFELSAHAWALLQRALEDARDRAATSLSDAEALEALACAALAAAGADRDLANEGAVGEPLADGHPRSVPRCEQSGAPSNATSAEAAGKDRAAHRSGLDAPSSRKLDVGETATHIGFPSEPTARVLCVIGRRGSSTLDEIHDESGLSFPELHYALLLLELDGQIRRASGMVECASPPRGPRKGIGNRLGSQHRRAG